MKIIGDFFRRKMNIGRISQLHMPEDGPPVSITRVLDHPRNVLIIPYNRMGTVLLATRVFKAFRECFEDAKITVAVDRSWSILIQNDPTIDEVFTFGEEIDNPHSRALQTMGNMLSERSYDLAFFLSYQFDTNMAYLTRLSQADVRISFRTKGDIPFFNVELVPSSGNRYEVDRYLEMLHTLGLNGSIRDYTMSISEAILEKARTRYLTGITSNRIVGFDLTREIVGSSITKKQAESYISHLIQTTKATVVVFFEPGKKNLAATLKETFGRGIIVVEDRPASMVAGMMSFCQFVVTHNTDLFQLSVALKTPTVSMLSGKEAIQWSPGENDHIRHVIKPNGSWPSPNDVLDAARILIKDRKNAS